MATKPTKAVPPPMRAVLVVGVVMTIIGSFLPWASTSFETVNGTATSDGVTAIVLALFALAFGFRAVVQGRASLLAIGTIVCAVLIILLALIDIADVQDLGGLFDASVGFGLWLTLIGGIVATVGGVLAIVGSKNAPAPT